MERVYYSITGHQVKVKSRHLLHFQCEVNGDADKVILMMTAIFPYESTFLNKVVQVASETNNVIKYSVILVSILLSYQVITFLTFPLKLLLTMF